MRFQVKFVRRVNRIGYKMIDIVTDIVGEFDEGRFDLWKDV